MHHEREILRLAFDFDKDGRLRTEEAGYYFGVTGVSKLGYLQYKV